MFVQWGMRVKVDGGERNAGRHRWRQHLVHSRPVGCLVLFVGLHCIDWDIQSGDQNKWTKKKKNNNPYNTIFHSLGRSKLASSTSPLPLEPNVMFRRHLRDLRKNFWHAFWGILPGSATAFTCAKSAHNVLKPNGILIYLFCLIGLSCERPLHSFACQPHEKNLFKTGRYTRGISAGRFTPPIFSDSRQISWQIYTPISAGRFTDWQIWWICQQIYPPPAWQIWWGSQNLPADLLPGRFTDWQIWWESLNLLTDLPPPISAGRFADWQIWWQSLNLPADIPPADLLPGRFGESVSRFDTHLPGRFGESASRFTPPSAWQIWWGSQNLPADLSPSSKLTDWQIWWGSQNLPTNLPPSRFTDW